MDRIIAEFRGEKPGPLLIAIAGLHGNEDCGVRAIQQLGEMLVQEKIKDPSFEYCGAFLGAIANLPAIHAKVRFIDKDMNRIWKEGLSEACSEEAEKQQLLDTILTAIDQYRPTKVVMLDLHTTSSPRGIFAVPTKNEHSRAIAEGLHCPIISNMTEFISGSMIQYFDDHLLNGHAIIPCAFEGGSHQDPDSISRTIAAMVNCMRTIGCVKPENVESKHDEVLKAYANGLPTYCKIIYIHHIEDGSLWQMKNDKESFQAVSKGELMAIYDGKPVYTPEDGLLLMPLHQSQGREGFFLVTEER